MKKAFSVLLLFAFLFSFTACNDGRKAAVPTADLKEMVVGAELPYLLYANQDHCIMNLWHGGVIVYDFAAQKISDRIPFAALETAGFSYPVASVAKDGKTIYFQEDTMVSKEPNAHSYRLDKKKLRKETEPVPIEMQAEAIHENAVTQALASDGLAYGMTTVVLEDTFIVSRLKKGGSLLSDTEIVFMDKALVAQKTFPLFVE